MDGSANIYFNDLDTSHVLVERSQGCKVAYHMPCWAGVKKEERKRAGKGADLSCLTPDCGGEIVKEESHY